MASTRSDSTADAGHRSSASSVKSRSPSLADIRWSSTAYDPRSFAAAFADQLPVIVRVEANGAYPASENDSDALNGQTSATRSGVWSVDTTSNCFILVTHVVSQERVIANDITGNTDVSLELTSLDLFVVQHPKRAKKKKNYKTLRKILHKYGNVLPITVVQKPILSDSRRRNGQVSGQLTVPTTLSLKEIRRQHFLAYYQIINDELSSQLSYFDVDANNTTVLVRVAESVQGDTTGLGWHQIDKKFVQVGKQLVAAKLNGPTGTVVISTRSNDESRRQIADDKDLGVSIVTSDQVAMTTQSPNDGPATSISRLESRDKCPRKDTEVYHERAIDVSEPGSPVTSSDTTMAINQPEVGSISSTNVGSLTSTTEASEPSLATPGTYRETRTDAPGTGSSGGLIGYGEQANEMSSQVDTDSVLGSGSHALSVRSTDMSVSSADQQQTTPIRNIRREVVVTEMNLTEIDKRHLATPIRINHSVENAVRMRTSSSGSIKPTSTSGLVDTSMESNDPEQHRVAMATASGDSRRLTAEPPAPSRSSRPVWYPANKEMARSFDNLLVVNGVTGPTLKSSSSTTTMDRKRPSSVADFLSPHTLSVKKMHGDAYDGGHMYVDAGDWTHRSRDESHDRHGDYRRDYVITQEPFADLSVISSRAADSGTGSSLTGGASAHHKHVSSSTDDDVTSDRYHIGVQIPGSSITHRMMTSSSLAKNSASSFPIHQQSNSTAGTDGGYMYAGSTTPLAETFGQRTANHVTAVRVGDYDDEVKVNAGRQLAPHTRDQSPAYLGYTSPVGGRSNGLARYDHGLGYRSPPMNIQGRSPSAVIEVGHSSRRERPLQPASNLSSLTPNYQSPGDNDFESSLSHSWASNSPQTRSQSSRLSDDSQTTMTRFQPKLGVTTYSVGQKAPLILGQPVSGSQYLADTHERSSRLIAEPSSRLLQPQSGGNINNELGKPINIDIGRPTRQDGGADVQSVLSRTSSNELQSKRSFNIRDDQNETGLGPHSIGYERSRAKRGDRCSRDSLNSSDEREYYQMSSRHGGTTRSSPTSRTQGRLPSTGGDDFRFSGRTDLNHGIANGRYESSSSGHRLGSTSGMTSDGSDDFRFEIPVRNRGKTYANDEFSLRDYEIQHTVGGGDDGGQARRGSGNDGIRGDGQPRRPMLEIDHNIPRTITNGNNSNYNKTIRSGLSSSMSGNNRASNELYSDNGSAMKQTAISFKDLITVQSTLKTNNRRLIPIEVVSNPASDSSRHAELSRSATARSYVGHQRSDETSLDRQQLLTMVDGRNDGRDGRRNGRTYESYDHRLRSADFIGSTPGVRTTTPRKSSFDDGVETSRMSSAQPVTSTPSRRSIPVSERVRQVQTDEKVDLVAVRSELRPVGSVRRSADARHDDSSELIDDLVGQMFDDVTFEVEASRRMLSELERARGMVAEKISSGGEVSDMREMLLQLTATTAGHHDNTTAAMLSADRSRNSVGKTTTGSPEKASSRTPRNATTMSARHPQNGVPDRIDVAGNVSTHPSRSDPDEDTTMVADDNNNNMSGLMSREQLERIMMWQTKAVDELDDCLDELDGAINEADSVSSISRPSTASELARSISSSSGGGSNNSRRLTDNKNNGNNENNKPQPAQFEYFFGVDVGVKNK